MPIENIYSFLTYPRNHEKAGEDIEGIHIKPDGGKLSAMLAEVFGAPKLAKNLPAEAMTVDQFCQRFSLSPAAAAAVRSEVSRCSHVSTTLIPRATRPAQHLRMS